MLIDQNQILEKHILQEIEASDVVVAGFDIKKHLDNSIWTPDKRLKPEIRKNLLMISKFMITYQTNRNNYLKIVSKTRI